MSNTQLKGLRVVFPLCDFFLLFEANQEVMNYLSQLFAVQEKNRSPRALVAVLEFPKKIDHIYFSR